jgi:CRISPR-associated endoribonuclease Cas6
MFASIEVQIEANYEFSENMGSIFQGFMMEKLAENGLSDYADKLHESTLKEYNQHLEKRDGNWFWIINTLTDDAFSNLWLKCIGNLSEYKLTYCDLTVKVVDTKITTFSKSQLVELFKNDTGSNTFDLEFVTPTAFKRDGNYVFFPELGLILKSLISKYDATFPDETIYDEDLFEQIANNISIISYNLKSRNFHLEGIKVPGFVGRITVRCRGARTMVSFLNVMFRFGSFSGIGIKNSIGMGAFRYSIKTSSYQKRQQNSE